MTGPTPLTPAQEARIDELVMAMTPAEKVGQLTQLFNVEFSDDAEVDPALGFDPRQQAAEVDAALARGGVGSMLFVTDPAKINRLQRAVIAGNRHGIPALFAFDVVHGFRTIFPVPIAMAASWDPELVAAAQSVAAREARAVGIHWTFAPMVDVARDPRWGRIVEGAGEDPVLGAAMAAAHTRGFQNGTIDDGWMLAGPKHFAGYGAVLGGRDYDEVNVSDYELWNVHLPPFRASIEAGAAAVMTAYTTVNGVPATGNRWLLTEILRGGLGFGGVVVSDANAVRNLQTHGFAADQGEAARRAVIAGVDMEMATADPAFVHLAAVDDDALAANIDDSVRRILRAKTAVGLFENPYIDETYAGTVLKDPAHREQARVTAESCAVLLRNDTALLPLSDDVSSIAVIGPLAHSRRDILGPWAFDLDLNETVTVLDGIRDRAGADTTVRYAPGVASAQRTHQSMFDMFDGNRPTDPPNFDPATAFSDAVDAAVSADVAIVVLGEWQNMVGEAASRSTLNLPGDQQRLLEAVVATGTPVILVLMNGRPLDLRWAAQHVPAILDMWYPGTQGGAATARLLFGDVSPAGKLPFTWPRSLGQIPLIHSYTTSHEPDNQYRRYWEEPSTPLYPFGFGLTYSTFEVRELRLDVGTVELDGTVEATVEVSNIGNVDSDEVVQLYLHQRHGAAARPVRELKQFRRVHVTAGATVSVTFPIGPAERSFWRPDTRRWESESSTFDVWVGLDSTAQLHASFRVEQSTR